MRAHLKKRYMFIQCHVSGMKTKETRITMRDEDFVTYHINTKMIGRRAEHRKTEKLDKRGRSAKIINAHLILIFFLSLYNSQKNRILWMAAEHHMFRAIERLSIMNNAPQK